MNPVALCLAGVCVVLNVGLAHAKDCTSADFDERLATGYCELPSDGSRINGVNNLVEDPFYSLDCTDGADGPSVTGLLRLFVPEFDFDCNGPQIGTATAGAGTVPIFDVPERLDPVFEVDRTVVLDRSLIDGVTGTGPQRVATLFDGVYVDTVDGGTVIATQIALDPTIPEGGGAVINETEVNFMLRSGFAGVDVDVASAERRRGSLRLYNAARTAAKTLGGQTPFDPDLLRFQTDVNVDEGNPTSMFFFARTDAACTAVARGAIELNQAGEEGQAQTSVFLDGFVPAAGCAKSANVDAALSYHRGSLTNFDTVSDEVTVLAECTGADIPGTAVTDVSDCVEVSANAELASPGDADTWPTLCFNVDPARDLDPFGITEEDLVVKKCEAPGGECCLVGPPGTPNRCRTSCSGPDCSWDVARVSTLQGPGQKCVDTPAFSEFSLAFTEAAAEGPASARVPFPAAALALLGAGLAGVGLTARGLRLRRRR